MFSITETLDDQILLTLVVLQYQKSTFWVFNGEVIIKNSSDFVLKPSCFENIVEAIALSNIRHSLRKISIFMCNLNRVEIERMFIKYEMDKVKVVIDGADPIEK